MKTTDKIKGKYVENEDITVYEQIPSFIRYFNLLSSIVIESFYVLDMRGKSICYVKPDSLLLCNYSVEDVLKMQYDYFSKIIHPEDISLLADILKIIFHYCNDVVNKRDEIDYFFCTYRLQCDYSFLALHPLPQMVYQRMKPIWINDQQLYLICSVTSSVIRETGILRLYNKDKSIYEEYSFISKRWKRKSKRSLTERERAILVLAQQGKSSCEIANELCKSQNTIRNQIKDLFSKLEVHSIQEAIEVAHHHNIL